MATTSPTSRKAFEAAPKSDKPVLIACKTTIGFGSPKKAGTSKRAWRSAWRGRIARDQGRLGWEYGPFEIPDDIVRSAGARSARAALTRARRGRAVSQQSDKGKAFEAALSGEISEAAEAALAAHAAKMAAEKPALATRASSGAAIEAMFDVLPNCLAARPI